MRQLCLDSNSGVSDDVLRMISANSSDEVLFPSLRELTWEVQSYPLDRLFLSPQLKHFVTYSRLDRLPDELISNLTPAIVELQASSLQSLQIYLGDMEKETPTSLRSATSSAVLRCGPSLTSLSVPTPLSDAATQHVMQLPKLAKWTAWSGPPRIPDLSLSDAFPQLEHLELCTEASLEWLPLFEANARRACPGQKPGQRLTALICRERLLDAAFVSPVMLFRGLVHLSLQPPCSSLGRCAFHLTDEDIAEITAALPNLVRAMFGFACSANSCRTTVSSLLFFSARCKNLESLGIHFNTKNLHRDLESMVENPRLRDLFALPNCRPLVLLVGYAPLPIEGVDYWPVIEGFWRIFPHFCGVSRMTLGWRKLGFRMLAGLRDDDRGVGGVP